MRFRPINQKDKKAVWRLEQQLFPKPYNQNQIRLAIRAFAGFVAKDNQKIIGYLIFAEKQDHFFIRRIGVAKEFQGQGVAQKLVQKMFERARKKKIKIILLRVRQDNQRAMGFYKKVGFEIRKRLKNYYGKNKDGLEMIKML